MDGEPVALVGAHVGPARLIDNFLWNLVIAYSMAAEQIPGGVNSQHVRPLMDVIVDMVFKAIVKK